MQLSFFILNLNTDLFSFLFQTYFVTVFFLLFSPTILCKKSKTNLELDYPFQVKNIGLDFNTTVNVKQVLFQSQIRSCSSCTSQNEILCESATRTQKSLNFEKAQLYVQITFVRRFFFCQLFVEPCIESIRVLLNFCERFEFVFQKNQESSCLTLCCEFDLK